MIKLITLLLFCITSQIVKSQPKNYKNTENITLKDVFPKNYDKMAPGCLKNEQLNEFKLFLKDKWNTNLDSIKTLHFYYSSNENVCKYVKKIFHEKNKFFLFGHSQYVTSIYKPLLYIKPESIKAESFWKNDISNYFFNLILKDYNTKFYSASITINSKGAYIVDFELSHAIVFNAFSNEVNKYSCE